MYSASARCLDSLQPPVEHCSRIQRPHLCAVLVKLREPLVKGSHGAPQLGRDVLRFVPSITMSARRQNC